MQTSISRVNVFVHIVDLLDMWMISTTKYMGIHLVTHRNPRKASLLPLLLHNGLFLLIKDSYNGQATHTLSPYVPYISNVVSYTTGFSNKVHLWHNRLGHLCNEILKLISSKESIDRSNSYISHDYHVCPLAKQKSLTFVSHNNLCSNPFDLVHGDVWSLFPHPLWQSILTVVDDCSRCTWIHMLTQKAPFKIKQFFAFIKAQFDKTVKGIRTNNSKEPSLVEVCRNMKPLINFVVLTDQSRIL